MAAPSGQWWTGAKASMCALPSPSQWPLHASGRGCCYYLFSSASTRAGRCAGRQLAMGSNTRNPRPLLSVQPLLPHASKHGLCAAASSLYSSSDQHRLPSPLETHTPAKVNNYRPASHRQPPIGHYRTHTMPNTPRHSRVAGRQPPAFIEIRPIQLSQWSRTDMTLEFTNCCFTLSRCSWCVWLSPHINGKCWKEIW